MTHTATRMAKYLRGCSYTVSVCDHPGGQESILVFFLPANATVLGDRYTIPIPETELLN